MNVYRVDADLAYGGLVLARTPKAVASKEQQLRIWTREFVTGATTARRSAGLRRP